MSMNYAAASATVIEDGKLKELFPIEHRALQKALDESDETLDQTGWRHRLADPEQVNEAVDGAISTLASAFSAKYPGLTLELCHHNQEEEGDRYDEVNGAFWAIGGVYILSEGAKKLGQENFARVSYVVFG